MKLKNFENVESYEEAQQWLVDFFGDRIPVWKKEELTPLWRGFDNVVESIRWAVALMDCAKNSAVRAAIHHVFMGDAFINCFTDWEDGHSSEWGQWIVMSPDGNYRHGMARLAWEGEEVEELKILKMRIRSPRNFNSIIGG